MRSTGLPNDSISRPTAVDLFAGAGGLSVGLASAGFDVRAAVELDPATARTYIRNHPTTEVIVDDVRRVTGPGVLRAARLRKGELSLLTGCPPCQGFSTLRTRKRGHASPDDRNDLLFEMLRLVRSILPEVVVLENVPGLKDDQRFDVFLAGLRGRGYVSAHAVVDAADFGVPQRRRRLVLVATRNHSPPTAWMELKKPSRTVREAIGGLPIPGGSGDQVHDLPERRSALVRQRIAAIPKDGGSRTALPADLQLQCHRATSGYSDVFGRMAWDSVAPTITSGCHNPSKGRFLHPHADRAITLREAALLQSFPADYEFCVDRGKEHVARQIGNAFPPELITPIAESLMNDR